MSNVVRIGPRLQARTEAAKQHREIMDRSAEHLRILSRAVRTMRESGASTKEIAHTLRMIARELESAIQPVERD